MVNTVCVTEIFVLDEKAGVSPIRANVTNQLVDRAFRLVWPVKSHFLTQLIRHLNVVLMCFTLIFLGLFSAIFLILDRNILGMFWRLIFDLLFRKPSRFEFKSCIGLVMESGSVLRVGKLVITKLSQRQTVVIVWLNFSHFRLFINLSLIRFELKLMSGQSDLRHFCILIFLGLDLKLLILAH